MKTFLAAIALIALLFAGSVDFTANDPQPRPTESLGPPIIATVETDPVVISREIEPEPDIWTVTAYCSCVKCCGKTDGITASGERVESDVTIAADPAIPFGTVIWIEGIGERIVQDRGSAITGKHIDLYIADHMAAKKFGIQKLEVRILE